MEQFRVNLFLVQLAARPVQIGLTKLTLAAEG